MIRPLFPFLDAATRASLESFCDSVVRLANGIQSPPEYADNAAAIAGGLHAGQTYRTSDGTLKVVY